MATDDISLGVGMEKLEIEPNKITHKNIKKENPFSHNLQGTGVIFKSSTYRRNFKCTCLWQKSKHYAITKKKHKLLREPTLRLSSPFKTCSIKRNDCQGYTRDKVDVRSSKLYPDTLYLHTLVDNCNQLSISSSNNSPTHIKVNECAKWWKCDDLNVKQSKESSTDRSSSGSCSQQALNPPCDVTIDELASYFETLVHIPKKMSSMAEMMYI